jgi:dephospho-CoA kinase
MLRIGLTGSIATGKSLVAKQFRELGVSTIDYDLLSREVVKPYLPAWREIVDYFGEDILLSDQTLDRLKLGEIIFNNVSKRDKLESFIHPRAYEAAGHRENLILKSDPNAVIIHEVPLLFEVGRDTYMDKTVMVYCSEANQLKRLMARDKLIEEDAMNRIWSQMSVEKKRIRADYVIDNNGTKRETKRQVVNLYKDLSILAYRD